MTKRRFTLPFSGNQAAPAESCKCRSVARCVFRTKNSCISQRGTEAVPRLIPLAFRIPSRNLAPTVTYLEV